MPILSSRLVLSNLVLIGCQLHFRLCVRPKFTFVRKVLRANLVEQQIVTFEFGSYWVPITFPTLCQTKVYLCKKGTSCQSSRAADCYFRIWFLLGAIKFPTLCQTKVYLCKKGTSCQSCRVDCYFRIWFLLGANYISDFVSDQSLRL